MASGEFTIQGNFVNNNNVLCNIGNMFQSFTNGISNKLVGVWYPEHYNEMVLVRVYGYKTDLLVDRKNEIKNIQVNNHA